MTLHVSWSGADAYDQYMGRWSRMMAREFVTWLSLPAGLDWAEIGLSELGK